MPRWIKIPLLMLLCVTLVIAGTILYSIFLFPVLEKGWFIRRWKPVLEDCKTLSQVTNIQTQEDKYLFSKEFPNGDWIAIVVRHSCDLAGPPDAFIVHDSKGATFSNFKYHVCAIKGVCVFDGIKANSLADFYRQISHMGLEKI